MSCQKYSIKGLDRGCKDSLGGIVKVWVSTDTNIYATNSSIDGSTGEISHFDTSVATYSKFKPFEFFRNTGSMTTTANISETAGTSFTSEVNLTFMKMGTGKRLEMMGLLMDEVVMIVKDSNKEYYALGYDEPCYAGSGTAQTGTNATELNGYQVLIKDDSMELPRHITDSSFITALENIVITNS